MLLSLYYEKDKFKLIQLESGIAEIEGKEIPLKKEIKRSSQNLNIYCWEKSEIILKSTKIKVKPFPSQQNKGTIKEYIIANYLIDKIRYESLSNNTIGPRVLIIGPRKSGAVEFSHVILNYALKLGYTPLFVDLDLENEITVPGGIGATLVDYLVPNDLLFDNGISYFFGDVYNKNGENMNWYLYEMQLKELGNACYEKLEVDLQNWKKRMNIENKDNLNSYLTSPKPTLFASGMVVRCPIIDNGEDIYKKIIENYKITNIFVIEDEKLKNTFNNIIKKNISLELISRLVTESDLSEEEKRQRSITKYLKGPFGNFGLKQIKLDMNEYKLIKIVPSQISKGMVPLGLNADLKIIFKIYTIRDEEELLKKLVCFVYLEEKEIQELDKEFDKNPNNYTEKFAKATVSYFGFIKSIDKENNIITIFCPNDKPVHKYILVGNIKYENN